MKKPSMSSECGEFESVIYGTLIKIENVDDRNEEAYFYFEVHDVSELSVCVPYAYADARKSLIGKECVIRLSNFDTEVERHYVSPT